MNTGGSGETSGLAGGPIKNRSIYPEVSFEVEIPLSFELREDETMRIVVDHALSQLNDIARTRLSGSMPEGVAPMFTYSCREAVEERHQKYLLQTVYAKNGTRTRKASIVEENDAAEKVAEELSINRHPVAQLIEQLREKHGSHIGRVAMSDVVVSIIKHTAYSRYRSALNKQIENWSPPERDTSPLFTGARMKGRLKPLFQLISNNEKTDKSSKNAVKQSPKRKTAAVKPKVKSSKNVAKAQSYGEKVKIDGQNIELKQKLPRPGHRRKPR